MAKWTSRISTSKMCTKSTKTCKALTIWSRICQFYHKRAMQDRPQWAAVWIWVKNSTPRSEKNQFQGISKKVQGPEMHHIMLSVIIKHRIAPWDLWPTIRVKTYTIEYIQTQVTGTLISIISICRCWSQRIKLPICNRSIEYHQINPNNRRKAPQNKRTHRRIWRWQLWKVIKAQNLNEPTPERYWKQCQSQNKRKPRLTRIRNQTEARQASNRGQHPTIDQSKSQRPSQLRHNHISAIRSSTRRVTR